MVFVCAQGRSKPGSHLQHTDTDVHPPSPLQSGSHCNALNGAMQRLHLQGGSAEMIGMPHTPPCEAEMKSASFNVLESCSQVQSAGMRSVGQSAELNVVPSKAWESKTLRESQMSGPEEVSITTPTPPQHKGRGTKRHSIAGSCTMSAATQQRRSERRWDRE